MKQRFKQRFKRCLSMLMVLVLILSVFCSATFAATGGQAETFSFTPADPFIKELPASRLTALEGTESVYFGSAVADLDELDRYYSIKIYREGSLETEASVSLLTLDVSASYGKDYELSEENVFVAEEQPTLLEKGSGSNTLLTDEDLLEQANRLSAAYEEMIEESVSEVHTDQTEEPVSEMLTDQIDGSKNDQAVPGSFSQSILDDWNIQTDEEVDEELLSEKLSSESLDFSAGNLIYFAKGESEKTIVFHILDDELEEGQEMFMFVLADAEGTVIRKQYTFSAVINDNEELHDAAIAFSQESYHSENGKATVKINRSGSLYSMIDFTIKSCRDTAAAGTNYEEFSEMITMQPWQTEAEYTFEVRGQGRMEVKLESGTACQTEGAEFAEVLIDVQETEAELAAMRESEKQIDALSRTAGLEEANASWQEVTLEGDGEASNEKAKTFHITIDNQRYTVEYDTTETAKKVMKGRLIDERYTKAKLVVGDYYFTSDEFFTYGLQYGYDSPRKAGSKYDHNDDLGKANGHLWWYTRTYCRTGGSWMHSNASFDLNAIYYKSGRPDWEGCDDTGYWHKFEWTFDDQHGTKLSAWRNHKDNGKFARTVDSTCAINMINSWPAIKTTISTYAEDNGDARNYNDLRIYGFAFFYKRYGITLMSYNGLDFRTAKGGVMEKLMPMNLKIGSEVVEYGGSYVYLNAEGERNTLVFDTQPARINNEYGVYGKLTSWDIVYAMNKSDTEKRTVRYPDDFKNYLTSAGEEAEKIKEFKKLSCLNYDSDTIATYMKNQVDQSLTRIVFDEYFAEYLQYLDFKFSDYEGKAYTEDVILGFIPNIGYNDVKVKIFDPLQGAVGRFTDPELTASDEYYVFHAGDSFDLSVTPLADNFVPAGYQISKNEGIRWDTIDSESTYMIPGNYEGTIWLRPVFTELYNRIEIGFSDGAEEIVEVQDLIPQAELDKEFKGRHILDINSEQKEDIKKRMKPVLGNVYTLEITTKETAPAGYEYRPYVIVNPRGSNPQKIFSRSFPVVAKSRLEDNYYVVGVELVKKTDLKTYQISGNVNRQPMKSKVVSADPTKYMPANGTLLITSGEEEIKTAEDPDTGEITEVHLINKQSSVADLNGNYKLIDVTARPGDSIAILASTDIGNGNVQYLRIPTGEETSISAGILTVTYPYSAPEVASVNYRYEDPAHGQEQGQTGNTIYIYDDTLHVYTIVNEKGRKAKEVNLVFYHSNKANKEISQQVNVIPMQRQKSEDGKDTDTWYAEIKSMNRFILSGDTLSVYIVDKEKKKLVTGKDQDGNKIVSEIDMVYPVMDTGLQFAEKVVMPNPQWYQKTLETENKINIPLAGGDGSPGVTSGVLNFSQVNFEGGYARTVGIGLDVNAMDIWNKLNRYYNYKQSMLVAKRSSANTAVKQYNREYTALKQTEKAVVDAGNSEINAQLLANNVAASEERLNAAKANVGDLKSQLSANRKARSELNSWLDNPKGLDTETVGGGAITFCITLDFVKAGNEYIYACGNLSVGFTLWAEHTRFKLFLGKIPGYINLGGTFQLNYTENYTTKKGAKAMNAQLFSKVGGNVSQVIATSAGKTDTNLNVAFSGHVTLGIGFRDLASAAGVVNASWQAFIPTYNHTIPKDATPQEIAEIKAANRNGHIVNFSGGIELQLLFVTLKFDVVALNAGYGSMEGEKEIIIFNGIGKKKNTLSEAELEEAIENHDLEILSEDGNERLTLVVNDSGSADLSGFGQGGPLQCAGAAGESNLQYSVPEELFENAGDNTGIQTVPTDDDGSVFMVFLANRSEEKPADALYWTVYDAKTDAWSDPALVDSEGVYEGYPSLCPDYLDDGEVTITVTWSSAQDELTEEKTSENYVEEIGKFRIKTSVFGIKRDDTGQKITQLVAPVFLSGKKATASDAKKGSVPKKGTKGLSGAKTNRDFVASPSEAAKEYEEEFEEEPSELTESAPEETGELTESAPEETGELTESAPEETGELTESAPEEPGELTESAPEETGELTESAPEEPDELTESAPEEIGELTESASEETDSTGTEETAEYFDSNGWGWYDSDSGKLYSIFSRYDLSGVSEISEILNPSVTVPKVYYAEYDAVEGVLTELQDISLAAENALLYTADAELIEVPKVDQYGEPVLDENEKPVERKFLTVAYIQDTDGDLTTEEDNDLKLCLIELSEQEDDYIIYPSIDIPDTNGSSAYAKGETLILGNGYEIVEEGSSFDSEGSLMQLMDYSGDPDGDGIDGISQTNAEIVDCGGEYWLTYLKDGYLFEMINIGSVLEEMFGEDYLADLYRERAIAETGENWWQIDYNDLESAWENFLAEEGINSSVRFITREQADELEAGIDSAPGTEADPTEDGEKDYGTDENGYVCYGEAAEGTDLIGDAVIFEDTAMHSVSNGVFETNETNLTGDSNIRTAITDYQLISDGTDVYIVYTDFTRDSYDANKELFCVKRNLGHQSGKALEPGEEPKGKDSDEEFYYSKPVQLTNAGHVIANFKADMTKDGLITVVSECYDQWIPEGGGIRFSDKSIIETKYQVCTLPRIQEDSVSAEVIPDAETGHSIVFLDFEIGNNGLEPQNGYRVHVADPDGNCVLDEERTGYLRSGDTHSYQTAFDIGELTESKSVTILLSDLEGEELDRFTVSVEPEVKLQSRITDVSIQADGRYLADVSVTNYGSVASEAVRMKLRLLNTDYSSTDELTVYKELVVKALAPGESEEFAITFQPEPEAFTDIGTIDLEAVLEGEEAGAVYTYVGGDPDMVLIENGAKQLILSKGTTRQLETAAVPFPEMTGGVLYFSENAEVAAVDENGLLSLNKNGVTTVYAYLPDWGYLDDITVIVRDQGTDDDDDDEGSSYDALPSYVDRDGTWKQDAQGNWTYTTRAGVKAADRWLAIARSTYGGGKGFEWFRFDKDGIMVTGWFRDSDDRTYYLQIVSDGNKGRMLTGWQFLDGDWYYFEPESTGYKGYMYVNTTTRDGYTVGQDGTWTGK